MKQLDIFTGKPIKPILTIENIIKSMKYEKGDFSRVLEKLKTIADTEINFEPHLKLCSKVWELPEITQFNKTAHILEQRFCTLYKSYRKNEYRFIIGRIGNTTDYKITPKRQEK